MKQFNLKEYLKNPRKVVTRDGRNVRIICTDKRGDYPVVALIDIQDNGDESLDAFTENGCWALSGKESVNDLFFAPEKHERYVNIFEDEHGDSYAMARIFESKKDAEKMGKMCDGYIATIKIEWEH